MTQKIPSSSLSNQSTITSAGTSSSPATLSGYWQLNQTLTGNINGNAGTATALAATRTIAGQSFNGTQDVSFTTDNVSEGTNHLYYLTSRAQADAKAVIGLDSAGAASGGGNLSYSSSTGHFQFSPANLAPYAPLLNPSFTQSITLGDGYDVIWITNGSGTTGNATNRIQANTTAGVAVVTDSQFRVYNNGAIAVTVDVNKNMTIGGSYYGDGSHLTGISQPTRVSQLTNDSGYLTSVPRTTAQSIYFFSGGYVGDYFSGTGLSATGLTILNFSSNYGGGCCGPSGWAVTFTMKFDQSFFDTYASGWYCNNVQIIRLTTSSSSTYWVGPGAGNNVPWNIRTSVPYNITSYSPGYQNSIYVDCTLTTTGIVVANSRYSPQIWPNQLYVNIVAAG